ncbi:hypothetical protein B0H13DRAFT_2291381 [Mycena leptocephala]|nr:hypothetical protein B0H13DRAFT_2291381 [Mycena leptocephala]
MDNPGTLDTLAVARLQKIFLMFPPLQLFRSDQWNEYRRIDCADAWAPPNECQRCHESIWRTIQRGLLDVKSQGSDGRFKASKLEKAIKGIVGTHSASQDPEERMEDTRRTLARRLSKGCYCAGRATSAAPTFFKQIQIGPPGIEEAFVDGVPHVYFRFNVERGMQDIQLNQWERLGDVAANTRQYLLSHPTQNQLVDAVKSLVEKIGRVSTQSLNAVPIASEFKQFNPALALVRCLLPPRYSRIYETVFHQCQLTPNSRYSPQEYSHCSKIGTSSEDGLLWLISQREEWMLLFDNADNPSIDLFDFFPKCTHGNIIITSRNPQLAVHGPRSHSRVGDMNETDAIDLLLLSAVKEKNIENTQNASEIVKELSCLPLAIIQAGAYISKFDCLHRYLSIYSQNRAKLLSQHSVQSHDDYRWTVYTTWQISFEQLSKAAASIPETIFEQAAESAIYSDEQEAQTLQEARKFLQNFLVYFDSGRFREAESLEFMLLEKWKQMHGTDHPDTLRAMANLAATYRKLGKYQEAEPLESIVLEKQKQLLGADHPDTLSAMSNLAATYRELGRYQEAEPLENIVLEKWKQLLGADHTDTLLAMANLAATYCELGRYQDAEPLDTSVLETQKQLLGANHPSTLMAMRNLAATYHKLGRYQEAEPLEGIVLEKRKQLLGEDHPDTLMAMGNLAATYHKLGRYKEAESLESIVLEKQKQLLGADHPDTLRAMANLAFTYSELGRYKEAEPLESIVLEKRKQVLGADHPGTLRAMANLAATYCELGRYQEAEQLESIVLEKQKQVLGADHPDTLYQEAESIESIVLEKRKQVLGADHPKTLSAIENLAATYRKLGRYQEAEYLQEQYAKLVGNDSSDSEA